MFNRDWYVWTEARPGNAHLLIALLPAQADPHPPDIVIDGHGSSSNVEYMSISKDVVLRMTLLGET
jgi:hypothetical protein